MLYELKKILPSQLYLILKSYLSNTYFDIKINEEDSIYDLIQAGVTRISVLGPYLYLIYIADIPTTDRINIATFADDTIHATQKLKNHLDLLQQWLHKWKVNVNNGKSVQITNYISNKKHGIFTSDTKQAQNI